MGMTAGEYSISALAVELRRDRRLIAKAIDAEKVEPVDNKSKVKRYKMADVVNALYGGTALSLEQERAELAKEQTRKLKRENDEAEKNVIQVDDVVDILQEVARQIRSILEALPLTMKRRIPTLTGHQVNSIIRTEIAKALNAIADIEVEK